MLYPVIRQVKTDLIVIKLFALKTGIDYSYSRQKVQTSLAACLSPSVIILSARINSPSPPASMPAITKLCCLLSLYNTGKHGCYAKKSKKADDIGYRRQNDR